MTRLFLFVVSTVLLVACGQSPDAGKTPTVDTTTTLVVKEPGAVLFTPVGDKLRSLKIAFGEKNFAGMQQINHSTMTADSVYLAGKGVKIIPTSATQLKFVRRNGEVVYINLNHPKYAWEIFLFNGMGDPVKADLTDIESAYRDAGFQSPNNRR
jgi:hypothetical protein